ncbi:ANTAR domain-containing response regulator [Litchfieldella xinjiangensis]|uniref:ANTAR domain-containing response regulator n=1 Tax=Litchfieldella xinjiangensis TaxID=1166948 RepID=UPI0005B9C05D|nr:ANTAR domain-containing protein [Halomonas xinjiangensis]
MTIRVLIVDAKPERSQELEQAMGDAGFEVVATVDEQQDLHAVVERLAPDAVIIDSALPSRDTLEHVGQLGRRYPKPMIMLAEQESPDLTRIAAKAGVSAYVVDHVQPALMRSMVNVAIASFESHRALKGELTRTQETLAQRRSIDRAKALVMELRSIGEEAAYQYLRTTAMNRRMTIHELAQELLTAAGKR